MKKTKEKEDNILVGRFIKRLRERLGFTQKHLAAKINVDLMGLSRYERGLTYPAFPILKRLAKALMVPADEIIFAGKISGSSNERLNIMMAEASRLNQQDRNKALDYVRTLIMAQKESDRWSKKKK